MKKILNMFNVSNVSNIRISAVDGSVQKSVNSRYFDLCDNKMAYPKNSNIEYAVLLSHLNAIETYFNSTNINYGVAMICEDDLSLDFIKYWNKDINTVIKEAPEDWDIIMLGYFSLDISRDEIYKRWSNEWGTCSYLINYKSKNKIQNLKKDGKWICNEYDVMVADNYLYSKLITYVYKYPYFTFPSNNNSSIHAEHIDYHILYKKCNYILLNQSNI